MQTIIHNKEEKKELENEQQNTSLKENYCRVVGLVLMILGMTVAMVLLDIELISLFQKN